MKEVRFRINVKAHDTIQRIAVREGVPMSYVMRGMLYHGLELKLKAMKKEGKL